jgi:hypothetical protein
MWKEVVMALFNVFSQHLLARTEENHKTPVRIASLQAEI